MERANDFRGQQREFHPPRKGKNFLDDNAPQKSLERRRL
jgi:hypothetical protein